MKNDAPQADANFLDSWFWYAYGGVLLVLIFGCQAGETIDKEIGQIGMCGASAQQYGEAAGFSQNLAFYHSTNATKITADSEYLDFNPYIPVGAYNTLFVSYWETGEAAEILEVTTSNPSIVAIDTVYESSIVVEATGTGVADITVRTTSGLEDTIEVIATDIDRVEFNHCCRHENTALYLTDTEIEVPVTYYDRDGERPIGYGKLPAKIRDDTILTWLYDAEDPVDLHFKTGPDPGTARLTPEDDGDTLNIETIAPRAVDGISVHVDKDHYVSGTWLVGGVLYQDDTPICAGKYPMRLETDTPSVCEFVDAQGYLTTSVELAGDQVGVLEQHRSEDCEIVAQLLDSAGDVVVQQRHTEAFGGPSSSSSSSSRDDDDWD